MFQYRLIARARADRRHVVLPEGDDERILRAADSLLRLGVADLTLLGEESVVRAKASAVGVDITGRDHPVAEGSRPGRPLRQGVHQAARRTRA